MDLPRSSYLWIFGKRLKRAPHGWGTIKLKAEKGRSLKVMRLEMIWKMVAWYSSVTHDQRIGTRRCPRADTSADLED